MSNPDPFLALLQALGVDTDTIDRAALDRALELARQLSRRPKRPLRHPPEPVKATVTVEVDGKTVDVKVEHSHNCRCEQCQKVKPCLR